MAGRTGSQQARGITCIGNALCECATLSSGTDPENSGTGKQLQIQGKLCAGRLAILLEISGDDAGVLQQAQVLNREADVAFPSMVGQLRLYEALLTGQVQINSPR